MAGIFKNSGCWSCGFDMGPPSNMFTQNAVGSANTFTPFSYGFSWSSGSNPGILLGTNLTTLIVGYRFYTSLPGSSALFATWQDATTPGPQVQLRVDNTGTLQFYRGSGTSNPIGSPSATGLVPNNAWAYYEMKVTISATVGAVECRINGFPTPVISATGLNTQATANTFVNAFILNSPTGNGAVTFYDDMYMLDTTGSGVRATYLGNGRIFTDKPNGAGAHTQFTPTNPTNINFTNVGNIPGNAAEYNFDSTVGDIDAFTYPSIGGSPTSVPFVNHWIQAELDTAGVRTVVQGVRSGGTDFFDTTFPITPSNGTYLMFNELWAQDPNTSADWTVTNANAAQLEYKIQS